MVIGPPFIAVDVMLKSPKGNLKYFKSCSHYSIRLRSSFYCQRFSLTGKTAIRLTKQKQNKSAIV